MARRDESLKGDLFPHIQPGKLDSLDLANHALLIGEIITIPDFALTIDRQIDGASPSSGSMTASQAFNRIAMEHPLRPLSRCLTGRAPSRSSRQ